MKSFALDVYMDGTEVPSLTARALDDGTVIAPLEAFSQAIGADVRPIDDSGTPAICLNDVCVPLEAADLVTWKGTEHARIDAFAPEIGIGWTVTANALHLTTESGDPVTGLNVGDRPPDVTLPDLNNGEPVSIGSFRGKKAIFYMWASW